MKLRKIALGLVVSLCLLAPAWAAKPEDALSARPDKSVYSVLRLEDLGGFLRWALSEENLKLIAAAPDTGLDEGTILLVTAALSKVPVKEAALVVSQADPKTLPFLQVALSVPAGAELDRLAEGKGTAMDLMTLVLGADNPLLAMLGGEAPFAMAPQDGNVYTLDDTLALAARDGLILLSLSMDDLKAGISALESGKDRLALKRRFDAGNFVFLHVDPTAMEAIYKYRGGLNEEELKMIKELFRAPFEVEMDFQRSPEKLSLSAWSPASDTAIFDFILADVPAMKSFLAKLASMALSSGSATDAAQASTIVSDLRSLKAACLMFWADHMEEFEKPGVKLSSFTGTPELIVKNLGAYLDNPEKYGNGKFVVEEEDGKWWVGYKLDGDSQGVREKLAGKAKNIGLRSKKSLDDSAVYKGEEIVYMVAR